MLIHFVRPVLAAFAVAGVLLLVLAPSAAACPFCDGGPSGPNEVRREVFGSDFWTNALAAAAPFVVVLVVVGLVLREPRLPEGNDDARQ
jgi:hypothetical protein